MRNLEGESYLIYGPPGSGKTTVAENLSRAIGAQYVSVGEITRREIAAGTSRGVEMQKCLTEVIEYPVELIAGVIEERLAEISKSGQTFLLDGFPKYSWEADAFVKIAEKLGLKIEAVIVIDFPLEKALGRVSKRRICSSCQTQTTIQDEGEVACRKCGGTLIVREDDKPEILTRRYNDYQGAIKRTLAILAKGCCNNVIHVSGDQSKDEILVSIIGKLEEKPVKPE